MTADAMMADVADSERSAAMSDLTRLDLLRLQHEIEQFLFLEAHLQDTHAYEEWEALWEDDATYWVPANGADTDPEAQMSILYDNRSRIGVRVRQLMTGRRHSQTPRSALARLVSNVRIVGVGPSEVQVQANVMIFEDNLRGETMWAARSEYKLRRVGDQWRLVRKKVVFVNNSKPLFTLAFLI